MKKILGYLMIWALCITTIVVGLDVFVFRPDYEESNTSASPLLSIQQESTEIVTEIPSILVQTLPPEEATPTAEKKDSIASVGQSRFRLFSLLLALLGAPLFAIMGAISLFVSKIDRMIFTDVVEKLTGHSLFITLPLFTFAGYVLSESKAPERLVRFSRACLGWFPGGTAFIVAVCCAFFTAFTGASGVTIIAMGGLLYPMLRRDGYGESFSHGIITSGGSLGLLFPPSLPLILYAVIANSSMQGLEPKPPALKVEDLFLAGVIPGTLTVLVSAIYGAFVGARQKQEMEYQFSIKELGISTLVCLPELAIPVIIMATFFGGIMQLNESAACIALYVVLVETIVYRDIPFIKIISIIKRSMIMIGAILIILMMAMAMTNLMIMAKVPDILLNYMQQHIQSPWTFLLYMNIFLLLVGCLMDVFSAILVIVPLIVPIAVAFKIDPLHLGVVFLLNLSIGYCTPPVGMNLFLSSLRFGKSIFHITYTCLPFLAFLLAILGVVTYIPALSTGVVYHRWILGVFFGGIICFFAILYLFLKKLTKKIDEIS